jgi:8-oxo-dGTP pyrophosphatase MutT (NUDIX family)
MALDPQPSATVVVLRDGALGLEVLLLERPPDAAGKSGPSVFPGGRVDPGDRETDALDEGAFRRAAIREALEEAGLALDAASLVPISRWITPEASPKRFDTWFYFACVDRAAEVRVDGSEIARHHWMTPRDALAAHARDAIRLAPPTFVTVTWLADLASTAAARDRFRGEALVTFRPRICRVDDGACMLYPGDAGYEALDPGAPGARHRLWAVPSGWRYERSSD